MTEFKENSCRLCLRNITDKGFQLIDVTRDILDVPLLELKFCGENEVVLCNSCRTKLNALLDFKLMCLNTDKMIIDGENILQDLEEIYTKENGNEHLTDMSYNHRRCRLCMQLISSENRCIGEEVFEAIHKLVPKMNISIIKDPVICKPCFDCVRTHNTFLEDCLESGQRIGEIFVNSVAESKIHTFPSTLLIKTENNWDKESEINDMEIAIKTECVDIKSEHGERGEAVLLPSTEMFKKECKDEEDLGFKHIYQCNECIYETESKSYFTAHCMRHKKVSLEVYRCDMCEYVTKKKTLLKSHILRHKDPSEVQMYRCDVCTYESRYKDNVIKHRLIHKDPSEVQMYSCNMCEYKTKFKNTLARHRALQHKDSTQVQMYKCTSCEFQSKYKHNIIKHQLIHKDLLEVQMYRCNECNYKTKHKKGLARHALRHEDPAQEQMYKCDACDFASRYKDSFIKHHLVHKDSSEVQMYECKDCVYKTKHKKSLTRHALRHEDSSQVQMYKCDACDYETRYKYNISKHQLSHKDPSCVRMYKCDTCTFETKYKKSLKNHELNHKKRS